MAPISRVKTKQLAILFSAIYRGYAVIPLNLGAFIPGSGARHQARQALEVQGAPEAQEESWIDATRCEDWWDTQPALLMAFFLFNQ